MASSSLLHLDHGIRVWALIPITVCTLLLGLLRHYLSLTLQRPPPTNLFHERDRHLLLRYGSIRRSSHLLTDEQYAMRKHFYTDADTGLLSQERRKRSLTATIMSPATMAAQMSTILAGVVPQMAVGAYVRYFFGGFAVARLPFRLPEKFRGMLQMGIEMSGELDVSYVSALSWYVLNLFGLPLILRLIVGSDVGLQLPGMSGIGGLGIDARQDVGVEVSAMDSLNIGKVFGREKEAMLYARHSWDAPKAEDIILRQPYGSKHIYPDVTNSSKIEN